MKGATLFLCGLVIGTVLSNCMSGVSRSKVIEEYIEIQLEPKPPVALTVVEQCARHPQCVKLSEAVFFEGRGEPERGQYAIAFTVINRRDANRWPSTVSEVVHQKIRGKCQYSYVCQFDEDRKNRAILKEPKAWQKSMKIASEVYFSKVTDFTGGADHYYNPNKVERAPKFSNVYTQVASIGDHVFYRSITL